MKAEELPETSLTVVLDEEGNQRLLFKAVESAVWTLMERSEEWFDPSTLEVGAKGSNSAAPMMSAEEAFGTWTSAQGGANDRAYYLHYRRLVWRQTGTKDSDAIRNLTNRRMPQRAAGCRMTAIA